jgi:hypothetical protein
MVILRLIHCFGQVSDLVEVVPFPILLFPTSLLGRRRIFGATLILLLL